MKYVIVTGGVVSGLGKGITSSSIGLLLKHSGLRITAIKIDPYLNTDAGTMSPYEHGEVFVLDDGGEADLDLGNYERFLDVTLTRDHNITTGKVYQQVINRERKGEYLGKTVQLIPHVTDAIQDWIERVAYIPVDGSKNAPDVCMIELGGTVGDIESMLFLEALRQFKVRVGADNFCLVHVSLVPVVGAVGEPKTKPTQHSVKELRTAGLHPDLIVCRSTCALDRGIIGKLSLFCMVPSTHVCSIYDVKNIYQVPLLMLQQHIPGLVINALRLQKLPPEDLPRWRELSDKLDNPALPQVTIGVVGKYTGLADSYLSISKSLDHAAMDADVNVVRVWIESTHLEPAHRTKNPEQYEEAWRILRSVQGILIPGGFGDRGVEGKILAVRFARTMNVPFLGICLGMQVAVIEFARNVLGLRDANSSEFDEETQHAVVVNMPDVSMDQMGGTMRLGARKCEVKTDSLAFQLYKGDSYISERHRHRYEVNPEYVEEFKQAGLVFSGVDGVRMEMIELAQGSADNDMYADLEKRQQADTAAARDNESKTASVGPAAVPVTPVKTTAPASTAPAAAGKTATAIAAGATGAAGAAKDAATSSPASSDSNVNIKQITHRFFFAVQFHPEFKSRPLKPSPPFAGFVRAAANSFIRKSPSTVKLSRADRTTASGTRVSPTSTPTNSGPSTPATAASASGGMSRSTSGGGR